MVKSPEVMQLGFALGRVHLRFFFGEQQSMLLDLTACPPGPVPAFEVSWPQPPPALPFLCHRASFLLTCQPADAPAFASGLQAEGSLQNSPLLGEGLMLNLGEVEFWPQT